MDIKALGNLVFSGRTKTVLLLSAFLSVALIQAQDFESHERVRFQELIEEDVEFKSKFNWVLEKIIKRAQKAPFNSLLVSKETEFLMMESLDAWHPDECNIDENSPKLIILGERHTCPGCVLERQKQIRDLLDNKILYAFESLVFNEIKSLRDFIEGIGINNFLLSEKSLVEDVFVLGFENNYLSGGISSLSNVLGNLQDMPMDQNFDLKEVQKSIGVDYSFGLFSGALIGVVYGLLDVNNSVGFELLSSVSDSGLKKELLALRSKNILEKNQDFNEEEDLAFLSKIFEKYTYKEIVELFSTMAKPYFKKREKEIVKDLGLPREMSSKLVQHMHHLLETQKYIELDEFIGTHLRNLSMATLVSRNYCEKSLSARKPLVVQMGFIHGYALEYLFKKNFKGPFEFRDIASENLNKSKEEFERELAEFLETQ